MAVATAYFSPATFKFLRELEKNNKRDWFLDNKARYEAVVRQPALEFITAIAPRLRKVSPYLVADARPMGGSLFRVNRDTRFSRDKSPYRTALDMSFHHEQGRHGAGPGLYLHLQPGDSFGGGGVYRPEPPALGRVRDAIVANPAAWKRIVSAPRFPGLVTVEGEPLKNAPKGYDPGHPFVEDLRRKNFIWTERFSDQEVCAPGFMDQFLEACKAAAPFNRFMAAALGVPW